MTKPPEPTHRSQVDPNMPLRLDVAARLAFPDGSIGVSSLRSEAKKGRLVMMLIANKHMVTLAEIDRMVELCRVKPSQPASGATSPTPKSPLSASSKTDRGAVAQAAALELARKLAASRVPPQAAPRRMPRKTTT